MKLKRKKIADHELLRVLNTENERKRKFPPAVATEKNKFKKIKENLYPKYLTELSKREAIQADESAGRSHQNKSRDKAKGMGPEPDRFGRFDSREILNPGYLQAHWDRRSNWLLRDIRERDRFGKFC